MLTFLSSAKWFAPKPTSSLSSRFAACCGVSPGSIKPFRKAQDDNHWCLHNTLALIAVHYRPLLAQSSLPLCHRHGILSYCLCSSLENFNSRDSTVNSLLLATTSLDKICGGVGCFFCVIGINLLSWQLCSS